MSFTLNVLIKALFVRALTYFNMYRLWGGIPMTDKVVTVAEALKIGRSSEQQVFDFLTGDLNQVINENMLPISCERTLRASVHLWKVR